MNAFAAAKWPTHYVAAESMSGRPRVLFLVGYPTFEAWEKDNRAIEKNAALAVALEKSAANDGELQTEYDQGVFTYDKEHSLKATDAVHARYFEITQFRVKPGKRQEFLTVAAMYRDGLGKVSADANWSMFESAYGQDNGGLFLALSLTKSLAEDDMGMMDGDKFAASMGADTMKKIGEMTADCMESQQTNLFELKPGMSYVAEEWVKADPFWKAKAPVLKKAVAPATP